MVGGGGPESVPAPGLLSVLPAGADPLSFPLAAGGASLPFPLAAGGDSLPFLLAAGGASLPFPLAAGGASLPFPLAAGGASLPFPLATGGTSVSFPLAACGASLPFSLAAGGASLSFPLAADAGTLSVLMVGSLEHLPPAVAAGTTVAVDWVDEVLAWVLTTLARHKGRGGRVEKSSMAERKSFLRTLGQEEGEGFGVEKLGVVGGVCVLCLGAGAWAGCCCEVDGCWVSECLDVGVVSASEGCVVIGVMVMGVVDEDVVHAGVSEDATGRVVDEEEEGDTVEAVGVVMSASGWCLCESLWDDVWWGLCLPEPLLCVVLGACWSECVLGIGWG
ncbi:hypothetical protein NDU88_003992 [Pleurodeles waltl]|uniref:Uncharacterized protein n=1 Tax=Pleurodeles waltl TaxID=8319 RepID=A0AAV7VEZ7_PLEWA|nr:hypothetical protein NDU88_003992 [Pleurodeles waltl]